METQFRRMSRPLGYPSLLVLICLVGALAQADALVNKPYKNLIIEVKPGLENCKDALKNLKSILMKASDELFSATQRLRFRKATVIVPQEMQSECDVQRPYYTVNEVPDVQRLTLASDHPVFGKTPWTQQSRGCGKPGEFLYLPTSFMTDTTTIVEEEKARIFVQEWAKYRWGVFQESGTKDDPVYPLEFADSYSLQGGTEWLPNYCADQPLMGSTAGSCQHPNCPFQFSQTQNASSSLLALSSVASIHSFCGSSNHMEFIPTKQNTMCNGKSIQEVFSVHPDSRLPVVANSTFTMSTVVLRNDTVKKYILLVDQSNVMKNTTMQNRWNILTSALKQWIYMDVVDHSQVGVALFTTNTTKLRIKLTSITSFMDRYNISTSLPEAPVGGLTKNVTNALYFVINSMAPREGVNILLIVDPNNLTATDTASTMIKAAGNNTIWPILFPAVNNTGKISLFQQLARKTGGKMFVVEDKTFKYNNSKIPQQSVQVQRTVVQHLRRVQERELVQSPNSPRILTTEMEIASSKASFQLQVGSNVNLAQPLTLVIYSHYRNLLEIGIYVNGVLKLPLDITGTSCMLDIQELENTVYDVNMTFLSDKETHLVEVLAVEAKDVITASFWSSHNLSYVSLDITDDPVTLFTKVTKGDQPVVGADVSLTFKSGGQTDTVKLKDNGGGPDITGNDGIYSTFWTMALNGRNKTYDMQLRVRSTDETYLIETTTNAVVCCGSSLNLEQLPKSFANVSIDLMVGPSYVKSESGQMDVFPPSKVTDLRAFIDYRGLNLNFTAPGDDLDRGYALEYRVWWRPLASEWSEVLPTDYTVVKGGHMANMVFQPPEYDELFEYSVTARDTRLQESDRSNIIRFVFPRNMIPPKPGPVTNNCPSCAGGIAGAFFGGLALGAILLALSAFLVKKVGKTKSNETDHQPLRSTPTSSPPFASGGGHVNESYDGEESEAPDWTDGGIVVVPSTGQARYYQERN